MKPRVVPMRRDRGDDPPAPMPRETYLGPETRADPWWPGEQHEGPDHTKHAGHQADRERGKP